MTSEDRAAVLHEGSVELLVVGIVDYLLQMQA